jgi:hypothetical protein
MDSIELPAQRTSFEQLRKQAIGLRRAGHSRREIKALLGIRSNETLGKALRGEPPPEWTRRPRAKDDLHAKARELRAQGHDYAEIAARHWAWPRALSPPGCMTCPGRIG